MSETLAKPKPSNTVSVVRGQYHKFMLIPIMAHNAEWFPAGPVTLAVEARVLGDSTGRIGERGASIHVFSADRSEEYARFDCFERVQHYHYILNDEQHNVVWGYDPVVNGPMLDWSLQAIRTRLPHILREAGAAELADRVERDGWDVAVLDDVDRAMRAAHRRTYDEPGPMIEEGRAWMARWKQLHPQFNTVEE